MNVSIYIKSSFRGNPRGAGEAAAAVQKKNGRYTMAIYKQAGNSIPVTIFESIFRKIILGETAEKEASNE